MAVTSKSPVTICQSGLKRIYLLFLLQLCLNPIINAQDNMTPELLWKLNRVSAIGLSDDKQWVVYSVGQFDLDSNKKTTSYYKIPVNGGIPVEIKKNHDLIADRNVSPNKKYQINVQEVKVTPVTGSDFYPELGKSNVMIFDNLNYRHWDTWEDGKYNHIIIKPLIPPDDHGTGDGDAGWNLTDIMKDEPYDCPMMPFGGSEDYTWNNDGTKVFYVAKKKFGTDYAVSTNTDIYAYDLASKTTTNLTGNNQGYDTDPAFARNGDLAWLQMKTEGNEADKNDIVILLNGTRINITKDWDGTVSSFRWSADGSRIYFNAAVDGTVQLFEVIVPETVIPNDKLPVIQLTKGQFDIAGLIGQSGNKMVVSRTDMNHAAELFTVDLTTGEMTQLTHVNDVAYSKIKLSEVKKRMVTTTDGKQMLVWVIYPPDFDPTKKYPTLLYCQGGPQSALSQFYSFRWNFQLMAAQGYIVVAPNRRGMPGHGVEWNAQISGDWGGQNIKDYLSAIDDVSKEPYVDKSRLGCVGASYGGYSVFYLAGIHENRFKTFIAHDGIFNTKSMYGTTEEMFFVNHDLGGPYWKTSTNKSYTDFNPIERVSKWNTPILIIQGGKDYRVPDGQAFEAFQAAQLQGIKSKLLYFPDENHWVTGCQNGLVWQHEFFKWLGETMR
jgi:dipeptidyl aminopeptidase/acylaminoacyl peptidase